MKNYLVVDVQEMCSKIRSSIIMKQKSKRRREKLEALTHKRLGHKRLGLETGKEDFNLLIQPIGQDFNLRDSCITTGCLFVCAMGVSLTWNPRSATASPNPSVNVLYTDSTESMNVVPAEESSMPDYVVKRVHMGWDNRVFSARVMTEKGQEYMSVLFGKIRSKPTDTQDNLLQSEFQDVFGQVIAHLNRIDIKILIQASVEVLKRNEVFMAGYNDPLKIFNLASERNSDGELYYDMIHRFVDPYDLDERNVVSSDEEEYEARDELNKIENAEGYRQIVCEETERNTVTFKANYLTPSEHDQDEYLQKRADRLKIIFDRNDSPLKKTIKVLEKEVSRKQNKDKELNYLRQQNDLEDNIPMIQD